MYGGSCYENRAFKRISHLSVQSPGNRCHKSQGQYSLATAVGLVKGVFGVMLVLLTHVTSKRLTGTGVW